MSAPFSGQAWVGYVDPKAEGRGIAGGPSPPARWMKWRGGQDQRKVVSRIHSPVMASMSMTIS